MIITISAAPRVDTSELAKNLSAMHGLAIQPDPSSQVCAGYGFQTIYEMPVTLQASVREQLIREHCELVSNTDDLLLNYSIFPWLADWMRWFWSSTPTERWEEIIEVAASAVRRYELIYHVENNKVQKYDGYLWLDERNSSQINSLLRCLYGDFEVSDRVRFEIG